MKSPDFTFLIDAYKYGQYVEKAVESALGQNAPVAKREILVVDDGSTDSTQGRLQKVG
jgi:glycosyltransferase involved in cell wall biosynthesis